MALQAELILELRRLLRHVDRLAWILFGCCFLVAAQLTWIHSGRALSSALPMSSALATLLSLHLWLSTQLGLQSWIRGLDARLGPGTGWVLLEAARLKPGSSGLAVGKSDSVDDYAKVALAQKKTFGMRHWQRLSKAAAWLAPLLLFLAAGIFFRQNGQNAAVFGLSGSLSALDVLNFGRLLKRP